MSRLHICNTFFEEELYSEKKKNLAQWLRSHPIYLQLQFLPLLYAAPEDKILVSDLPENPDPRLCLIDDPPKHLPIEHWGPSLAIHNWAKTHHLFYPQCNWELVQKVNSKIFSFLRCPKLPHAQLLHSLKEVNHWIQTTTGKKVIKLPFETAGRGHLFPTSCEKFFASNVKRLYNYPLIGEPWVERVLDFSSQWENGKCIALTPFENTAKGTYVKTTNNPIDDWALKNHLQIAEPLIQELYHMGYHGNIGLDAFIYRHEGENKVHPIVEINGRKTMSWVGLKKPIYYDRVEEGLLPTQLNVNGKVIRFTRNVQFTKI